VGDVAAVLFYYRGCDHAVTAVVALKACTSPLFSNVVCVLADNHHSVVDEGWRLPAVVAQK
jgi:hypothetical protein